MKRLIAIAILTAACGGTTTPSATPTAAATPVTSPEVVEFTGDNDVNTAPFELAGGSYISRWTKESGCTFGPWLRSLDESESWDLGGSYSDGPVSGETWAYHVEAGTFYLDVQGSCRWTLTLTTGLER